ncbi:MAG TPA: MBL fold metallo-hydrolase [Fervidicoccus fontis]|jgi:glyoxylase-like metal-dependent hydrolase (beta-lactamase superfamily II)|uniref:MBL fold metallo-hydrolase n=1 Tax=Fervidicoccus fontis TaxID=683846 RepID=A0A7C2Z4I0_9CREN|nr:MAG: hypothetical protein C0179_05260 [Fervidicoccus sp.]HEU98101.1 MBL fold metallo-hydrolase [Fervidicoccus fontis]
MVSFLSVQREKFLIEDLEIIRLTHGVLKTNSYIVKPAEESTAVVIDPGEDPREIIETLDRENIELNLIVLTHGHFDHACSSGQLSRKYGVNIAMSSEDLFLLDLGREAISRLGIAWKGCEFWADIDLSKEGNLSISGELSLEVLRTPGHTPGSVVLLDRSGTIAFTGDTLFRGFVGRTDFPGGNEEMLKKSLKMIKDRIVEDAILYPGHGPETRLRDEMNWLKEWLEE